MVKASGATVLEQDNNAVLLSTMPHILFCFAETLICFCWIPGQCGPQKKAGWSLILLPPVTCGC